MPYVDYKTLDGTYSVDWEAVHRIIRGSYLYQMARTEMKVVSIPGERFGDVDLKQVEIPWKSIRPRATDATGAVLGPIIQLNDIKNLYKLIHNVYLPLMTSNKQVVRDAMSKVQTGNAESVNRSVSNWGAAATTAKVIRDTSFTAVCIGATVVGGPAGVALAALGSGGKGGGKYQDTANIGSALIETTASFITTVIPIGALSAGVKSSATLDGTLVMLEASFDTTQNMIEGDAFVDAVTKAGAKQIVGKALGKLVAVDKNAVELMVSKSAIPVKAVVMTAEEMQKRTGKLTGKYAAGMVAEALADTGAKMVSDYAPRAPANMAAYFTQMAKRSNRTEALDTLQCQLNAADLAIRKKG